MSNMVEVKVFETGDYKIEDTDNDHVTQKMNFYDADVDSRGVMYYCKKEKADVYLKRLAKEMIKVQAAKITEARKSIDKIEKILAEVKHE